METYHLYICINSLVELDQVKEINLPEVFRLKSSNEQDSSRHTIEDFFWGEEASWKNVKERLEDYRHLSFLRSIKLNVHYWNYFQENFSRLNSDCCLFHFYDGCLSQVDFFKFFTDFGDEFKLKITNEDIGEKTVDHEFSKFAQLKNIA